MTEANKPEVAELKAALKRVESRKKRKPMLFGLAIIIVVIIVAAFFLIPQPPVTPVDLCANGVLDLGEEDVDCGGNCLKLCVVPEPPYVDSLYTFPISVADISVDLANDKVYVVDEMRHRVMIYNKDFEHLSNFGEIRTKTDAGWSYESGGNTNDRLLFPGAIYAANNKIYVLDRNQRIQVFSNNFVYEKTLIFPNDAMEVLPKVVDTPNTDGGAVSIAVSSTGNFYVSEETSNTLALLGPELNLIKAVEYGSGNGEVIGPRQVVIGPNNQVFVADSLNNRIQVFDLELNFVKSISENLKIPTGVTVSENGMIFVLDSGDNTLKVFNSSGSFVEQRGGRGTEDGSFYNPKVVRLDSSGNIYVVEEGNARVQVFNPELAFLESLKGIKRSFSVSFTPFYPAISPNGDIAFSDSINSKVFVIGPDFELKKVLGGKGFGNEQFNTPKGLAFDSEGNLFVSDPGNMRVQVFSPDYEYLKTIANDKLVWPLAISISEEDKIFVVDDKYKKVLIFDSDGTLTGEIGLSKGITLPLGILAQGEKIYITDDKDKTIEIFDSELNKIKSIIDIDGKGEAHIEFNESLGIDSKGRLLFCDNRNRAVIAVDTDSEEFFKFGNFGSGGILELSILEVAATPNLVVVADMEEHRIKIFDSAEKEIKEIKITDLN